jgi:hypothetical protein
MVNRLNKVLNFVIICFHIFNDLNLSHMFKKKKEGGKNKML